MINLSVEFDRQVQNLLDKGYPKAAGISEEDFKKLLDPLKDKLSDHEDLELDIENGKVPFVIVFKSELVDSEKAMELLEWQGKNGFAKLYPHSSKDYSPIESVNIPEEQVYFLIDINRGSEYLNIRPEDALKDIQAKGNSPLTIDEGIALVTQFPEILIKNHCFSLAGSRMGNQTVPAIWINAQKQANLGWCWDRNPHTWLGSAYCKNRI